MNRQIFIDSREISASKPPYVIAELSGNHNGDIGRALELVDAAAEAGASAIKLQTYTADTLTINSDKRDFLIQSGLWKGQTLYSLYEAAHTPWNWHEKLIERANKHGVTCFSTPFDITAVNFLNNLTPAFKIASFEAVDVRLVRYAAQQGKPLIISTGMADLHEIELALQTARDAGCQEVALLHCISSYPAPIDQANLRTISDMSERFDCVIGLSDHTLGTTAAIASIALGARIIEKHFTLARGDGGPDAAFSLEPDEFKALTRGCFEAWTALGNASYERKPAEEENLIFRRSLYVVADIKRGDRFSDENVRSIRPGFGISPKYFDEVIGKTATRDIDAGTALNMSMVSDQIAEHTE